MRITHDDATVSLTLDENETFNPIENTVVLSNGAFVDIHTDDRQLIIESAGFVQLQHVTKSEAKVEEPVS